MTERIDPPKFFDEDQIVFRGVDTVPKSYWFEVTDTDSYRWDIKGRYVLDDSGVWITAITVEPSPLGPRQPPKQLDPELLRRLTRLPPLKDLIKRQELIIRQLTRQGLADDKADGRESRVLAVWAREQAATEQAIRPWRSRFSDDQWAEWALDFVDRVREWQGTYGILTTIADEQAWGEIKYQTVRDRVKTMRRFSWIKGEGTLTEKGPRLLAWQERKEAGNGENV